jgi:monovalent cation/hydrogen antiporter
MPSIDVVVGLFVVTIPLVALARRAEIPYPVVLVLGGLVLGFVPGLPPIQLPPDLVLIVFLPPLLYWESVTAPTGEMRANAAWIWSLALGLVIATTIAVAATAHAMIPGMGWAVAFVLGALVAPTDETASLPTLERFAIPRRLVAVIEGESLLNDAGALIIYVAAIGAVVTGAFSLPAAILHFVVAGLGAVAIGLSAGWLAVQAWRRFHDSEVQQVISLVLPFAAYLPAQRLGWSGVLAVVTAGVYVNRFTPLVITPVARLRSTGFWGTIVFLANVVVFMLVGLQLHGILGALRQYSAWTLVGDALVVNAVVIGMRFLWGFTQGEIFRAMGRIPGSHSEQLRRQVIAGWAGVRGGVSLAAALAIPVSAGGGQPFPNRDLLIYLTFSVILVTLVGGVLTLPLAVRWLKVEDDGASDAEERTALTAMAAAALATIADQERRGALDGHTAAALRRRYERERARAQHSGQGTREARAAEQMTVAEREILDVERGTLIALRNRGDIDNVVLRRLQTMLDMAQFQLDERV